MCFESCFIAVDNNDAWYSDTGASQHITNDSSKFVSFKMFDKPHSCVLVARNWCKQWCWRSADWSRNWRKMDENLVIECLVYQEFSNNLFQFKAHLNAIPTGNIGYERGCSYLMVRLKYQTVWWFGWRFV